MMMMKPLQIIVMVMLIIVSMLSLSLATYRQQFTAFTLPPSASTEYDDEEDGGGMVVAVMSMLPKSVGGVQPPTSAPSKRSNQCC
ncbi:unnamed protein product [Linum trigynum]|uniref:Secreted protein n=1 Tax=Linum trigynum TaxID=586398 RepID=A0AAV2DFY4_9ROSI